MVYNNLSDKRIVLKAFMGLWDYGVKQLPANYALRFNCVCKVPEDFYLLCLESFYVVAFKLLICGNKFHCINTQVKFLWPL